MAASRSGENSTQDRGLWWCSGHGRGFRRGDGDKGGGWGVEGVRGLGGAGSGSRGLHLAGAGVLSEASREGMLCLHLTPHRSL